MRITIIIDDRGQGLDIRRGLPSPDRLAALVGQSMPAGSKEPEKDAEAPAEDPAEDEMITEIRAGRLLTELNVDNPGKIMRSYRAERVIEVCEAAIRRREKLKNPAGYVLQALQRGWAV